MHTARLIETIEAVAEQRGQVVKALTRAQDHEHKVMLGMSPVMERGRQDIEVVASTDYLHQMAHPRIPARPSG